jgi:uncharacterized protein YyaL (SSP411 family)
VQSNRLIHEKSPYLLQHAHNPVDWYPWGQAALDKARQEDKPIFLSIGYSTCHWCHVMERESFENEDVARVLNENFVPVKVDREERPDLDRVYMLFVQASTGSGGWPMSVWLTPDGKPFFGGTYFAPDARYGRPGFVTILQSLARAWREERDKIEQSGTQVLEQLRQYSSAGGIQAKAGQHTLDAAFQAFRRSFDARLGGFGAAPKFPRPSVLNFLLRYGAATENEEARDMVLLTLRAMAKGGMHDQLGGGFHRYSVDENWLVPHFEKMLYDQAQLAASYLEAYQISGDAQYAAVARDIFDYVLRDLTHSEGGFYSAEDADSAADPAHPKEKSEGAFYIWRQQEIEDALGAEDAAVFCRRFGVEPRGNVHEDPHGEFGGRNILYQAHEVAEAAESLQRSARKLLEIRSRRPRPHLDDKILTGWNGLMISAFAKGAQILDEPRYVEAARGARSFLHRRLWREADFTLLRRYRDGDSAIEAFLDDYAALISALVDLYETSFDPSDLAWASRLAERAIAAFEDPEGGGFFSSPANQGDLVLRLKDDYDGAEPSGNSVMALALLRLARITGRNDFQRAAERTLEAFAGRMASAGAGLPQMLVAQMFALGKPMEIVLAGPSSGSSDMLREIRKRFLPNAVVMRASEAPQAMPPVDGLATAYVCENYACNLPVTGTAALAELLQ